MSRAPESGDPRRCRSTTKYHKLNPTLKKLVSAAGGIDKVDSNAVASWRAALLFRARSERRQQTGGTLSRQSLFDALKQSTRSRPTGSSGPADIYNHIPPGCIVMTQVKNGKLVRTYRRRPAPGLNEKNLVEIKMDLS